MLRRVFVGTPRIERNRVRLSAPLRRVNFVETSRAKKTSIMSLSSREEEGKKRCERARRFREIPEARATPRQATAALYVCMCITVPRMLVEWYGWRASLVIDRKKICVSSDAEISGGGFRLYDRDWDAFSEWDLLSSYQREKLSSVLMTVARVFLTVLGFPE